ncbi:Small acid-soluble spore protein H family protein [Gracilibacillus ureilyticus]|uniref:Small acid-soluble spore protein H family protein n=1 Tax=Gracilibacillus ureilyticus TaxID=531814 RepID=A0A1H9N9X2_9BACI|nr:H-type small acid-soluble spore protein [Gracilibacillus ureilyticus]SER32850.1 Small acid-soluble spore protein H family protein [Gracilibacillus ureilyticus]
MNIIRAKEITQDPDMKDVEYLGKSVYILSVDEESKKALVRYREGSDETVEVDVRQLNENE